MDNSPSTSSMAPLLLRNLLISIFVNAHTPLLYFSHKSNLLHLLRSFLASAFIFLFTLFHSIFSSFTPYPSNSSPTDQPPASVRGVGSSGVSRALSQLLIIMNDIPVSSRKYEVVRSLIDKLIDDNLSAGNRALREINCAVLSAAFSRSLEQVESAAVFGGGAAVDLPRETDSNDYHGTSYLVKGIRYIGRAALRCAGSKGEILSRTGSSAEKVAAELMWVAQKMAASGCVREAVDRWASAEKLARLAFSAEPRLQGSLVKISAFLINKARELEQEDGTTETPPEHQEHNYLRMKLLSSWLPLLCCANNGTDAPILSATERAELEKTLEDMIPTLDEQDQELVLALWLHHFTHCPGSDWPNLRAAYTCWYAASRALLLSASAPLPALNN